MTRKLRESADFIFNGTFRHDRPEYRLLRPVPVFVSGEWFTCPTGFITDFGSIPKWADDWFGIDVRVGSIAFLKHDLTYATGCVPRHIADRELRADLTASGVSMMERTVVYLAVRTVGGRHYYDGA